MAERTQETMDEFSYVEKMKKKKTIQLNTITHVFNFCDTCHFYTIGRALWMGTFD